MDHTATGDSREQVVDSDVQSDGSSQSTDASFHSAADYTPWPQSDAPKGILIPSYATSERIVGVPRYQERVVYSWTKEDILKKYPKSKGIPDISILVEIEKDHWRARCIQNERQKQLARPVKMGRKPM